MSNNALYRMKRSVKIGTFSFVACLLLAALLIALNCLAALLPAKVSRFDLSGSGLTSVTSQTKDFIGSLQEDVTIYWVCPEDQVDEQMKLFLSRYSEGSKHVTVKLVDPTVDTQFLTNYGATSLETGSFVIESAKRYTTVDIRRMYLYTNPLFAAANEIYYNMAGTYCVPTEITKPMSYDVINSVYEQYGSAVQRILMYGGYSVEDMSTYQTVSSFCGESQLTAALDYVTRDYIPHAYILTGYGDAKPTTALTEYLAMLDTQELDLKKTKSIPVDAGCLILFSPTEDMTAEEAALVTAYLNAGGSLVMNTSPETVEKCPNIMSLGSTYGVSALNGEVEEGNTAYFKGSTNLLLPTVSGQSASTDGTVTAYMPNSHAITYATVTGVTVNALMTTSDTAERVSLADGTTVLGEKGKHDVAVVATKAVTDANGKDAASYLVWFGSANALTETAEKVNSGWSNEFYVYMAASVCRSFVSTYSSITPVTMPQSSMGDMTMGWAVILTVILTVLIPSALLITGVIVWAVRKRR